MSKNELLPCPFCGKDDELRITHIYEGEDYIGCYRCKYDGVHITMWNSRVYQKDVLKAVERDSVCPVCGCPDKACYYCGQRL